MPMRKEFVIGICFVAAGVICASLFGYPYFSTYGFLNEYHVQAFAKAKIDLPTLLANIVWKRGKLFLLIWMAGYTPLRRLVPRILKCALFFAAGMFAGACMINMGLFGFLVFFGSWIPHGIFYLFAVLFMFYRDAPGTYGSESGTGRKIVYLVSVFSLFVLGCVTEATAGTWILQKLFWLYSNSAIS